MSREQIVDKSDKTEDKRFKVGKWYKPKPEIWGYHYLTQGRYYEVTNIGGGWVRVINDRELLNGYDESLLDVNSELDYNPATTKDLKVGDKVYLNPNSHYAAIGARSNSNPIDIIGKIIHFRESHETFNVSWDNGFSNTSYKSKDLILVKGLQTEVEESRIDARGMKSPPIRVEVDSDASYKVKVPSAITAVNIEGKINLNTTKEESKMAERKVVNVKLIDNDKGLDVQYSLVHDFGDVVTEDSDSTTIQELIINTNVLEILDLHNEIRRDQVDLEILQRTGNTVNLRDKKLKDLTWIIK